MKQLRKLAVISLLTLLAAPANACQQQGKIVKWFDDFQWRDPSWGAPNVATDFQQGKAVLDISNGKAVMKVPTGLLAFRSNTAGIYDDISLCLKVTLDANSKPPAAQSNPAAAAAAAGALFWFTDKDNFYAFLVDPSGRASVIRKQNGHWTVPIGWTDAHANPAGAANELNVVISGNQVSLYLNDKLFNRMRGTKPNDGSLIGFFGQGSANDSVQIEYSDLKITDTDPNLAQPQVR